ncbi:MAG: PfkB family carbohydrate kinase [Chloroflexota bacterium]
MKIVSIGEATIDRYIRQKQSFVGGIALNFAVHAKRCGADQVAFVSCIGNDDSGKWILDTLGKEQIDTTHLTVLPGETAECDISVTDDGERSFPGYRVGVLKHLKLTKPIASFISQQDVVSTHYDGETQDSRTSQLINLSYPSLKRVVDFGDWSAGKRKTISGETLDALDIAFFSGDSEAVDHLQSLAKQTSCLFIVTLGAAGSIALTQPEALFQPAIAADVLVDTTGCGDAFQAGFTVSYYREGDIAKALLNGATQAAQVLNHFGAFR